MIMTRKTFCALMAAAGPALALAQSGGDPYPLRPVTIVAPTVPGGSAESEMRQYLQLVSQALSQQFIIVHKPGAGGTIGADFVAKAKPDGYTLLLGDGNFGAAPVLYKNLPYDPIKNFAPVIVLSKKHTVLMVHPSLPVNNAREYFEYAKANPGKINFGAVSSATRLNGMLMHKAANVDVTIVDYKGTGDMLPDLLAGRIHGTAITFLSSMPYIKSGKTKALGISASERSKLLPDLPTIAEQGAPRYTFASWVGLLAPAGTPKSIVNRLSEEFAKSSQDPALRRKLEEEFTDIVAGSPAQASEFVKSEVEMWRSVGPAK